MLEIKKVIVIKPFGRITIISFLGFVSNQTYFKSVQSGIYTFGEVMKLKLSAMYLTIKSY